MTNPQIEATAATAHQETAVEVKQPLQYHQVDESMSEWERARLTSKTWSMEQE